MNNFYYDYDCDNNFGIVFSITYNTDEKDLQLMIKLGYLAIAIGYVF